MLIFALNCSLGSRAHPNGRTFAHLPNSLSLILIQVCRVHSIPQIADEYLYEGGLGHFHWPTMTCSVISWDICDETMDKAIDVLKLVNKNQQCHIKRHRVQSLGKNLRLWKTC